eukprot:5034526-Pleurochrysis_carterae.AAC.1
MYFRGSVHPADSYIIWTSGCTGLARQHPICDICIYVGPQGDVTVCQITLVSKAHSPAIIREWEHKRKQMIGSHVGLQTG